ncbi:MAG: hypothetical protein JRD89_03975 [Deltaproteobacteria bacterium]|nr:hypothetical protein [Deltaproteobacteria bacterium]
MVMLTPTQFIRQAALKTPHVPVAMGKVVEYTDVPLADVPDTRCWLCGGLTGGRGQPVKKTIKDTFTDRDKARWPGSKSVCPGCAFCLSFMSLRNYSILATEAGLRHPSRPEIRNFLLEPPEPPFVFCIAISGQRWLHFRAQVAYDRDGFPVQFEDTMVCVWRKPLTDWLSVIEQLYAVFSKEEIRTGRYNQNRIKQFGLAEFQAMEEKIAPHRGTRLFDLAIFVAQKLEEKKKEEKPCSTTLIQTTSGQLQLPF